MKLDIKQHIQYTVDSDYLSGYTLTAPSIQLIHDKIQRMHVKIYNK